MNVLIVLAHPDARSFNASLAEMAQAVFSERCDTVRLSDLYRSAFDPSEAARHFSARRSLDAFDVQAEQRFNWDLGSLPADVREEIDKILWADVVILQFPLWWFGPPAILKGWMDRVFVYGGLYTSARRHDRGVCRGKKVLLSVTAGSAEAQRAYDGREGDTRLILWPTCYALRYVGFTVLEPSIIYGVHGRLRPTPNSRIVSRSPAGGTRPSYGTSRPHPRCRSTQIRTGRTWKVETRGYGLQPVHPARGTVGAVVLAQRSFRALPVAVCGSSSTTITSSGSHQFATLPSKNASTPA